MQIAILGRQTGISLAELESLYGESAVTPLPPYAALIDSNTPLPQSHLGGTMKSATVITELKNTDANGAFLHIQDTIATYTDEKVFEGKIQLGFSLYGFKAQKNWLLKKTLEVKKVLKKSGRSVRIIENKAEALEAAQILYNKLTGPQGIELLIIKHGANVILAQTTAVQDIDAYAERDFGRPMRDAFVGMLPPKLAQIMINLATGGEILELRSQSLDKEDTTIEALSAKICILDPFCGTGVVLQEVLLMGYDAYGTDISEKMVEYSTKNLQWLESDYTSPARHSRADGNPVHENTSGTQNTQNNAAQTLSAWRVQQGDATTHQWNLSKIKDLRSKIYIATETYLGTPLSSLPDTNRLERITHEANQIAEGFLKNIAAQIEPGTKLCVALPAWHLGSNQFKHLGVLDQLGDMGYNRLEFVHAKNSELIYHREDQVVARELTILEKK
jgi:tRNA G10  N-methylase Trm11